MYLNIYIYISFLLTYQKGCIYEKNYISFIQMKKKKKKKDNFMKMKINITYHIFFSYEKKKKKINKNYIFHL